MDQSQTPEWFLELAHGRVGPFTLEQLKGFLEDGEVPAHARVTSDRLHGMSVTVDEALRAEAPDTAEMPPIPDEIPPPVPFRIPAPMNLDMPEVPSPATSKTGGSDLALVLFDTLQSAKERTAKARIEPPPVKPSKKPLPRKFWLYTGTGILLVAGIIGIVQWFASRAHRFATNVTEKTALPTSATPATQPLTSTPNLPLRGNTTGRAITIAPPPMQRPLFSRPAIQPPRPLAAPQNPTSSLADTQRSNDVPQADPNEDRRFDQPGNENAAIAPPLAVQTPNPEGQPPIPNPGADPLSPQFQQVDGMSPGTAPGGPPLPNSAE